MIGLENRKINWLTKQGEDNDEDLNFFRVHSTVYETTASHKKVIFEVKVPKHGGR
jgi:hypothetical protein